MADVWKGFSRLSWATRIVIILGLIAAVSSLLTLADELNKTHGLTFTNSTEEARYKEAMQNQNREWGEVFEQLDKLLREPKFFDADWKVRVATQLNIMQLLIDDARQIDPPLKYDETHDVYMQGLDELGSVTKIAPEAIEKKDLQLIRECRNKMGSGKSYLRKAVTLMDEVSD